ncbi:hypothetical protein H7K45_09500 [Mycobacterium yunnanensis]|uniref:Uncharacterized protein n=1 Tax=Mycobacterium yunnanensis TaxID=368477 RepID=A0A9X3C254_9MYCO|nr:hypothetical protein [Mycobacterium yunnanensis]MCV7420771.1 hypothetical protein [Mycobacterium yunnanensis]
MNTPAGPPNWGPQRPWASESKPGGLPQWAIIAVALVAVLGVIAGATVYFTRDSSSGSSAEPGPTAAAVSSTGATPSPNPSDFASAADTGPVGVVTEEPTCAAWTPVNDALNAAEQNGWAQRDPSTPATAWSANQKATYEAVGAAMRTAADQTVALAKQTPHRVVRELYEQTAAYLGAYADGVATYVPANDALAQVATSTALALTSMCEAIGNGSAAARAGLVPPAAAPTAAPVASGPPTRFFQPPTDPVCTQWHALVEKYTAAFAPWRGTDPTIAAAQWGPAQQRVSNAVAPVMVGFAGDVEALAQGSANAVFQDFATFAGEYRRAFAAALPTYVPADGALTRAASAATGAIDSACLATEG